MSAEAIIFGLGFYALAKVLRSRLRQREMEERVIYVEDLCVYPLKGARGHSVTQALLGENGFVWDRMWMVVRGDDNLFTTARQIPLMVTLEARVLLPQSFAHLAVPPAATVDASVHVPTLRLTATVGQRAGASIDVPVVCAADLVGDGKSAPAGSKVVQHIAVWGSPVSCAVDQGDAVADWLTAALADSAAGPPPWNDDTVSASSPPQAGEDLAAAADDAPTSLRLVFFDPSATSRPLSQKHLPADAPSALASEVVAQDGYPLLLASSDSLWDLNRRLPHGEGPLSMARFRPNIVVYSFGYSYIPWAEDSWRQLSICGQRFWGVKRCSRCKVPSIDEKSGTPHPNVLKPEPLMTMRRFRSDQDQSGEVYFGVNLVQELPDRGAYRPTSLSEMPVLGRLRNHSKVTLLEVVPIPPL